MKLALAAALSCGVALAHPPNHFNRRYYANSTTSPALSGAESPTSCTSYHGNATAVGSNGTANGGCGCTTYLTTATIYLTAPMSVMESSDAPISTPTTFTTTLSEYYFSIVNGSTAWSAGISPPPAPGTVLQTSTVLLTPVPGTGTTETLTLTATSQRTLTSTIKSNSTSLTSTLVVTQTQFYTVTATRTTPIESAATAPSPTDNQSDGTPEISESATTPSAYTSSEVGSSTGVIASYESSSVASASPFESSAAGPSSLPSSDAGPASSESSPAGPATSTPTVSESAIGGTGSSMGSDAPATGSLSPTGPVGANTTIPTSNASFSLTTETGTLTVVMTSMHTVTATPLSGSSVSPNSSVSLDSSLGWNATGPSTVSPASGGTTPSSESPSSSVSLDSSLAWNATGASTTSPVSVATPLSSEGPASSSEVSVSQPTVNGSGTSSTGPPDSTDSSLSSVLPIVPGSTIATVLTANNATSTIWAPASTVTKSATVACSGTTCLTYPPSMPLSTILSTRPSVTVVTADNATSTIYAGEATVTNSATVSCSDLVCTTFLPNPTRSVGTSTSLIAESEGVSSTLSQSGITFTQSDSTRTRSPTVSCSGLVCSTFLPSPTRSFGTSNSTVAGPEGPSSTGSQDSVLGITSTQPSSPVTTPALTNSASVVCSDELCTTYLPTATAAANVSSGPSFSILPIPQSSTSAYLTIVGSDNATTITLWATQTGVPVTLSSVSASPAVFSNSTTASALGGSNSTGAGATFGPSSIATSAVTATDSTVSAVLTPTISNAPEVTTGETSIITNDVPPATAGFSFSTSGADATTQGNATAISPSAQESSLMTSAPSGIIPANSTQSEASGVPGSSPISSVTLETGHGPPSITLTTGSDLPSGTSVVSANGTVSGSGAPNSPSSSVTLETGVPPPSITLGTDSNSLPSGTSVVPVNGTASGGGSTLTPATGSDSGSSNIPTSPISGPASASTGTLSGGAPNNATGTDSGSSGIPGSTIGGPASTSTAATTGYAPPGYGDVHPSSTASGSQPTACGEHGDFVMTWDDLPPYEPRAADDAPYTGIVSLYHHFFYASGYNYYAPDKDLTLPSSYDPVSGPNTAIYLVDGPTDIDDRIEGDTYGMLPGAIGAGARAMDRAYWFNAYSAELGCDNGNSTSPCEMIITAYRWDDATMTELVVNQQSAVIQPCKKDKDCELQHVALTDFDALSSIRFEAVVDETQLKSWVMDNLSMGWYDNSCEAGLKRISSRK